MSYTVLNFPLLPHPSLSVIIQTFGQFPYILWFQMFLASSMTQKCISPFFFLNSEVQMFYRSQFDP